MVYKQALFHRPLYAILLVITTGYQVVLVFHADVVDSYVTSQPGTVPLNKQFQWLKQLTDDICSSKIGDLTTSQVSQTRDLMYEWSHNPKLNTVCTNGSDECAIAVESLLKRVVDEQNAITTKQRQQVQEEIDEETKKRATTLSQSKSRNSYSTVASSYSSSSSSVPSKVQVTVDDYNCVLEGWARSNSGIVAADRCEQIVHAMLEYGPYPNLASFKACLMAWKQTMYTTTTKTTMTASSTSNGESIVPPVRAQQVLELMIRLHYENQDAGNTHINILPDADCFDTVLQTWSRYSGSNFYDETIHAPTQAEYVLGLMDQLYRRTGNGLLQPRKNSLNAVLATWARSKDVNAATRTASILQYMEYRAHYMNETCVAPDSASYNIVMNAFAQCSSINNNNNSIEQQNNHDAVHAAKQAEQFVRHVVDIYKQSMDVVSDNDDDHYHQDHQSKINKNNKIIGANAGRTSSSSSNHQTKLIPDTILFNTAMGLWGKAKLSKGNGSRAYKRAKSILDLQLSLYEQYKCINYKPDVVGFTTVIGCCATDHGGNVIEKEKAFHVALKTYRQLEVLSELSKLHKTINNKSSSSSNSVLTANHVTYGAMLKVCAKLLPPQSSTRYEIVNEIFTKCKHEGYVGEIVIKRLKEATTGGATAAVNGKEWYKQLMEGYSSRKFPSEWSCNVQDTSSSKQRRKTKSAEV